MKLVFTAMIFVITVIFSGCTKENDTVKTYPKPQLTIHAGDARLQADTIHFVSDTVYLIEQNIVRNAGQVLKVDAGALIKMNDLLSITINSGARIEATGTASDPIVFTSSAPKGTAGRLDVFASTTEHAWSGIAIYGNYPADIDNTPAGTGILRYVRIEFAGTSRVPSTPLILQNVGKGTEINNIQISYSVAGNSFQISGGNFEARNLVSYASGYSDFVLTDGYTGKLQNLLAYRHPFFAPDASFSITTAGLFITGLGTFPSISNMTVVGPDVTYKGIKKKYFDTTSQGFFGSISGTIVAPVAVTGGEFHIRNSVFGGFPKTGFYLGNAVPAASLLAGTSDFMYSTIQCPDEKRGFYLFPNALPPYTSYDFKDYLLQQPFGNELYFDESQLLLTDPYNYDINPNPFPMTGSPLLTGASFEGPVFSDPFFTPTSYRGALGTDNWLSGWTNFLPLQTNYNN